MNVDEEGFIGQSMNRALLSKSASQQSINALYLPLRPVPHGARRLA